MFWGSLRPEHHSVLLPRIKTLKKDDRCSRDDDVRAGRGSPCAILLLWFSMAASLPGHSARSFALALVDAQLQPVPLLPRPKKQNAPRSLRC